VIMNRVMTETLRVLRATQLAMLLLFFAYFVSVQVNAVAYLAGRKHFTAQSSQFSLRARYATTQDAATQGWVTA